jgi:four helix bundle protein
VQDFTKLKVWQKAHVLAIDLKRTIDRGPKWDFPNLRGQTLRAAGSIADAIAEGCGKKSNLELARYCDIAAGSAKELLGQLMRARDLGLLTAQQYEGFEKEIEEIRRMLWSLAEKIRKQHGDDH